jgi:tetratricopeptide (TPR) repeat protein
VTLIAQRFTPIHPLSPYLLLVRDQDGTPRVLKRMPAPDAADPEAVLRFRLEAWRASQLEGPHFARAFADDTPDAEGPYYTMAYAQGPAATLVAPHELTELTRALATALHALHQRGWVHGGLEPAHLRRTEAGLVLVGYGHLSPIGQPAVRRGHPDFEAPEQRAGRALDGRADLYSLGALLHYWLTNRPPGAEDRLSGVEHPLVLLTRRLLAERPEDRPDDAAQVLGALSAPLSDAAPPHWVPGLIRRPAAIAPIEGLLAEGAGANRALTAPAGAGKSRYLDLADEVAGRNDRAVLRASGRGPLGAPLAPMKDLLDQLAPLAIAREAALAERLRPRLTLPTAPEAAAGLGPVGARQRWLAAVAELFEAVAGSGLLVLLDDWHLADEASRRAQAWLAERLHDAPIVWLVAGEGTPRGPDARGPSGDRTGPAEQPLPPFTREEGFALVAGLLPGTMAGPDVERLVAASNGSPWYLETLIAQLRASGGLRRDRQGWVLEAAAFPPHDAGLARLRAGAWPTDAWTVGGLAALAGPTVSAFELTRLLPEPELLAEGLDALLRAGVLTPGPAGYHFTHPAYASLLTEAWPDDRRRAVLSQLVDGLAIDTLAPDELPRWYGHALAADRPDLVAPLALASGRLALSAGSFGLAREMLEEGMVTLDTEHPARGAYMRALADSYLAEGRFDDAREVLESGIAALGASADRLAGLLTLGTCLMRLGRMAEARTRYREAVGHARHLGDPDAMALALAGLTEALAGLGEADEALVGGETALAAAGEAGPLPRASALAALGSVLAMGSRERQPEGVALLQQAIALYEAEGDRPGLVLTLGRLADAEVARGELRIAEGTARRAMALALELDDPRAAAAAGVALSAAQRALGHAAEAASTAHTAAERATRLKDAALRAEAISQASLARQALGEGDAARALSAEAVDCLSPALPPGVQAATWLARAEVLLAQGRRPEAAGALTNAEAPVTSARRPELAGRRALLLGRWAAATGDRERARHEFKSVLGQPNQYLVACAALALGRLAGEAGALAEAAGWLEQARRGAVTLGVDPLAREAAEAEQALTVDKAPVADFEGAAWRLKSLLAEADHLLPLLVEPAQALTQLRDRVAAAEAVAMLWRRLFEAPGEPEAAQALTEAIFAGTRAERVFVLGRMLAPLAARSREGGDLPYSPSMVRLDLCRAAIETGRAVSSEPSVGAIAKPIPGTHRAWGVVYVVGAGTEEPAGLQAMVEAVGLVLDRLEA